MIKKYKYYFIAGLSILVLIILNQHILGFLKVVEPIIPPLLAIVLALVYKNVFIALFTGCFSGYLILSDYKIIQGIDATLMSFIKVFEDNDNTIIILLIVILGGLIYLIERSGGIKGFVELLTSKRSLVKSKSSANLFTWLIGLVVFTSGTLSNLITGTIARPISDSMKVSHEKLAYMVHSTSTPICILIPFSGWGAFMIGLLEAQGIENGTEVLAQSIPLNFYALLAVLGALYFGLSNKDFGLMKKAEIRATEKNQLDDPKHRHANQSNANTDSEQKRSSWLNVFAPLFAMIIIIIVSLFVTGNGQILNGDGMKSILWGIVLSLFLAMVMYKVQKIFKIREMINLIFKGGGEMISVASILMFAFSMGSVVNQLEAGAFLIEHLERILIPELLPAIVFIISCVISFSTGTSMGSMAVIMPLIIPMSFELSINIPLIAAAIFGGSIFGDHVSPISDTTVLSCATTGCNIMDHVRTQLPYGVLFASIAVILFGIAGFIL